MYKSTTPKPNTTKRGGSHLAKIRQSLLNAISDMKTIVDAAQSSPQKVFHLNGVDYCAVPGEERFNESSTTPDLETSITALQVMKNVLPHITRTRYTKPEPPVPFFLVGLSSRRKIMRAFQLWYDAPPITPETEQFIPFFEHLALNVPNRWEVQQEYGACRWATKYADDSTACSLLLHFGYAPDYKIPMGGCSIHKLTLTPAGINLDIEYHHTFQDRLDAACAAIEQEIQNCILKGKPRIPEEIISAGMIAFSYHQKRYCSINKEYRMAVTNMLNAYIEGCINALDQAYPPRPQIHEPEEMLPDQEHFIEFSKFVVPDGPSTIQRKHLAEVAAVKNECAITPKLAGLPKGVILTRKDFPASMTDRNLSTALKNGILLKPAHGKYIIPEEE